MQNDKIKEYWEGEAGIYSEGIKAELKSETAENWKNLILEYAPEKEHLEDKPEKKPARVQKAKKPEKKKPDPVEKVDNSVDK